MPEVPSFIAVIEYEPEDFISIIKTGFISEYIIL